MNADDALAVVGGGKFRATLLLACFHLNTIFGSNFHLMNVIAPYNETSPIGVNGHNHTTISDQFNLNDSQTALVDGGYIAGIAIGSVASGQLADVYGRKPVLIINLILMYISSLISAFASSWQIFVGERFFTGIFQGGAMVANFLLLYEFTEGVYTGIVALFYFIFQAIGILKVALLGFLLPTWHLIIIVIFCSGIGVPFIIFFLIPESCRWLYAVGNTDKAEDNLARIAKMNKKDDSEIRLARDIGRDDIVGVKTLSSLLGLAKLRNRLLIGIIIWFLSSVVYFGANIEAPGLNIGIYWRLALLGALEIPVFLIVMFQIYHKRFGRKGTLITYLCLATLSFAVIAAKPTVNLPEARTCIQVFSKIGATGAFALIYLQTAEMFPNQVRGVALGLIILASSAGAIAAHYVRKLESTAEFLPNVVLASAGLVAAVLSFLLPKTLNRPFPNMIKFSTPASYQGFNSESDEYSINEGD